MHIERILADDAIHRELVEKLGAAALEPVLPRMEDMRACGSPPATSAEGLRVAAIVRRFGRPVLFIRDGAIVAPECLRWREQIEAARAGLEAAIPAVGRIEAHDHPHLSWLGTGWLVGSAVLATNRHVAAEIGRRRATGGCTFKRNPVGRKMSAGVDFRREHGEPEEAVFPIREILHIEDDHDDSPDLAFLAVGERGDDGRALPEPVPLASGDPEPDQTVGVVGYAAWDGQRNETGAMEQIFGDVYGVKRLHPGEVMTVRESVFTHDCSTLGGNSGSPVLDFATGEAVGIHFAGCFERENYAVKASTICRRLLELGIS